MTTTSTSLIQMIFNLLDHPSELAAFQADPQTWLASCGSADVTPADVHDALVLAHGDPASHATRHHTVPPPPHPSHGETHHEAAVRYLDTYITNYVDDRQTLVDNSVHQQVDTHGGAFDQDIDVHSTVASGDGAVAAGGDVTGSTVVTGHDDQVGTGNIKGDGNVQGDDNEAATGGHDTTSFGSGNASSSAVGHNLTVGTDGAFATGGGSTVDTSDDSAHNVGNTRSDTSTHDSDNDLSDNHVSHSGNTETDSSEHDSHTTTDTTHVHDAGNVEPDSSTHIDAHT